MFKNFKIEQKISICIFPKKPNFWRTTSHILFMRVSREFFQATRACVFLNLSEIMFFNSEVENRTSENFNFTKYL